MVVGCRRLLGCLALGLVLSGCSEDLTELVVVIDTDYRVPDELDALRVSVEGPSGAAQNDDVDLARDGAPTLPLSLYLEQEGELGPVRIDVAGTYGGSPLVERAVETRVVEGESRMVYILLERACEDVSCPGDDETCSGGDCVPVAVPAAELPPWDGRPPVRDGGGGPPDGGMDGGDVGDAGSDACTPRTEACNGMDDDCDGTADEGYDLDSDPDNCGECGNVCTDPTPLCGGSAGCVSGCGPDEDLCGDACVDTETNVSHCGSCGNACPSEAGDIAVCSESSCTFRCRSGFDDCNGEADDGCEQALDTLSHCGSCGSSCSRAFATETCAGGSCAIGSCDSGWRNCDGMDGNGCEYGGGPVYVDTDGDGFGDDGSSAASDCPMPGHVANADDCDDTDPMVAPGAPERCNQADDDCDGSVDESTGVSRGNSCTSPWILDSDTTLMGSTCTSSDTVYEGCADTFSPDEVFEVTTARRGTVTVTAARRFDVLYLGTACGSTALECSSGTDNRVLSAGTYYYAIEHSLSCSSFTVDFDLP